MIRDSFITISLVLLACQSLSAAPDQADADKVPPIVPAREEIPVRGVPAFSIHRELEQCLKDAATLLGGENGTLHVRVGIVERFYSPRAGFVLRADFTRDDVAPPLINRIICWHTGQLIASRISAPPLSLEDSEKAVAVPRASERQN